MDSSIKTTCRVCLTKATSQLHSLGHEDTRQLFEECTSLTTEDNYPQQLCTECYAKCLLCHIFRKQAVAAHQRLESTSDPLPSNLDEEENELEMTTEGTEDSTDLEWGSEAASVEIMKAKDPIKVSKEKEKKESPLDRKMVGNPKRAAKPSTKRANAQKQKRTKAGPASELVALRKKFKCGICDKRFPGRTSLKQHEVIHTGVKEFSCDRCGREFNRKGNFERHQLIHTSQRSFKSPNPIPQQTSGQQLHSGVSAFPCAHCPKIFVSQDFLEMHLQICSGEIHIQSRNDPHVRMKK